jgi:hypothetical protein
MSMRIVGCLFILAAVACLKFPLNRASGQEPATLGPLNWQYQVVTIRSCDNDSALAGTLTTSGRQNWELVSFQQLPSFPNEAAGKLLFRLAATGPGKDVQPQLADSFQGTVDFKLPDAQPGSCRLLFKRPVPGAPK